MNLAGTLQSNSGRAVFAAIWAGILAACWRSIDASAPFQALANRGREFNWAMAILYTTALYLALLTLLLWIGLAVYLVLIHQFKLLTLARGLAVMLFVLFAALGIESFVRAEHVPPVVEYILRWLPMFASVYAGCRFAVPRKPGELFARAAGKP